MSWKAQQIKAISSLYEVLQDLAEINVDDLVRRTELGTRFDFSAGAPIFDQTLSLLQRLRQIKLPLLPTPKIHELTDACRSIRGKLHEVREFAPTHDDPQSVRDSLIESLDSILSKHFFLLTSVIASSEQDDVAIRRQQDEVAKSVDAIKATRERIENNAKETDNRAKSILDQAQRTASSVGLHSHAQHFQKEADKYQRVSKWWLFATAVLAATAAVTSVCTISLSVSQDSDWVQFVQMLVGRFSLMAIAYFVAIWASRMYRAARHNEVVNRHRGNAMKTFETFSAAAEDDAAKDAILMRATECIFSHQASGFSDNKETGSPKVMGTLTPSLPITRAGSSGDSS